MARAKKGGEVGANGEFYEGGRFINTIPENRKKEGSKPRKPRKVEIAPYEWVIQPEGKTSIYQQIAGIFGKVINGQMVVMAEDVTFAYYGRSREEVTDMVCRWNAGDRWL